MAAYEKLAEVLLTRDKKISKNEIELLSKHLKTGGKFAEAEFKFLAGLRNKEGLTLEEGFDDLFLKALADVVLSDGLAGDEHVALLNKHVGAKSSIDAEKRKQFFDKLKKAATSPSPKFLALYDKLYPAPKEEKKEEPEATAKPKPAAKPKPKKKEGE